MYLKHMQLCPTDINKFKLYKFLLSKYNNNTQTNSNLFTPCHLRHNKWSIIKISPANTCNSKTSNNQHIQSCNNNKFNISNLLNKFVIKFLKLNSNSRFMVLNLCKVNLLLKTKVIKYLKLLPNNLYHKMATIILNKLLKEHQWEKTNEIQIIICSNKF